jgi:predicted DNA-binding protein (MmcQ/YjbR family)
MSQPAMDLHDREGFRRYVTELGGVSLHEQWESLVAKVGGKVFCLLGDNSRDVVFKVSEIAFDGLVEMDGIGQAPYFARRQWVRVEPGALEAALLEAYVSESHRLVAAKLTRKLRAELGLQRLVS